MTSERTKRRHMGEAGFISVGPVWLTAKQAARAEAEDAANREAVLGKQEDKADD